MTQELLMIFFIEIMAQELLRSLLFLRNFLINYSEFAIWKLRILNANFVRCNSGGDAVYRLDVMFRLFGSSQDWLELLRISQTKAMCSKNLPKIDGDCQEIAELLHHRIVVSLLWLSSCMAPNCQPPLSSIPAIMDILGRLERCSWKFVQITSVTRRPLRHWSPCGSGLALTSSLMAGQATRMSRG